MRSCCWMLIAPVVMLAGAMPASATELAPSGPWMVNFDETQCFATRAFGQGGAMVTLGVKRPAAGGLAQILIVRDGFTTTPEQRPLRLYVDGGPPLATWVWVHGAGPGASSRSTVFRTDVPAETYKQLREAREIKVEVGEPPQTKLVEERRPNTNVRYDFNTVNLTLTLARLSDVADKLETCVGNLQGIWNVGEAHASRVKQGPRPDKSLESLMSRNDYPDDANLLGQEGTTEYLLLVDERGNVADCTVVQTSGFAALDSQTCALAQRRAKFAPAVGANGQPVKSTAAAKYRWKR